MAASTNVFNDKETNNWVKASLALNITKEGLAQFLCIELKKFHTAVGKGCGNCSIEKLIPCPTRPYCNNSKHNCHFHKSQKPQPCSMCDQVKHNITLHHRYSKPSWRNTHAENWASDCWEIGKCFLPPDGYNKVSSVQESDLNGLISILLNCTHFQNCLSSSCLSPPPPDKQSPLEMVRQIGRDVRHTPDCKVTDADLQGYFQRLSTLLADPKCLQHDHSATIAHTRLSDLQNDRMTLKELGELLKETYQTLQNAKETGKRFSKEAKRRLEEVFETARKCILAGEQSLNNTIKVGEQSLKSTTHVAEQTLKSTTHVAEQRLKIRTQVGEQSLKSTTLVEVQSLKRNVQVQEQRLQSMTHVGEQRLKCKTHVGEQRLKSTTQDGEQRLKSKIYSGNQCLKSTTQVGEQRVKRTIQIGEQRLKSTTQIGEHRLKTTTQIGEQNLKGILQVEEQSIKFRIYEWEQRIKSNTQLGEHSLKSKTQVGEHRLKSITQLGEQRIEQLLYSREQHLKSTTQDGEQRLKSVAQVGDQRITSITQLGEQRIESKTHVGEKCIESKKQDAEQDLESKIQEGTHRIECNVKDGILRMQQAENTTAQKEYERGVADLRQRLMKHYIDTICNVPLSTFDHSLDKRITDVYATPKIHRIEIEKDGKRVKKEEQVLTYKGLFYTDDKSNQHIYIQGEPGRGKSTFAVKLVHDWCNSNQPSSGAPIEKPAFEDRLTIQKFKFLFFITLRDSRDQTDVTEMIKETAN